MVWRYWSGGGSLLFEFPFGFLAAWSFIGADPNFLPFAELELPSVPLMAGFGMAGIVQDWKEAAVREL